MLVLHLFNIDFKFLLSKQTIDFPNEGVLLINEQKEFFVEFVNAQDSTIIIDIDDIDKLNWDFIEGRIKSQIANNIWGKEYLYRTSIDSDPVIIKAIDSFSEIDNIFNKK